MDLTETFWLLLNASFGFILAVTSVRVATFLSELWKHRSLMTNLQKAGKPMPKHHPIFGHMLAAKDVADRLPPVIHSAYILDALARKLGNADAFYFDTYPIAYPLLVVTDPYLANQATAHPWTGAEKPLSLQDWFAPITGREGRNLFAQNGAEWKANHDLFLPFFNNSNLDATMPVVIDEMLTLRQLLTNESKKGDLLFLEPFLFRLMNDIIGRIVFNAELRNQTTGIHPLSATLLRQLALKFAINNVMDNVGQLNPLRKFEIWYNGRQLDGHIRAQIQKRTEVFRSSKVHDDQTSYNSILDQALVHYYAQPGRKQSDPLDDEFMAMLCAELRMFFFAGSDSTASVMMSACYLVWKHPEVLSKLRAEHDEVFGRNTMACPNMIAENPALLNYLPYTTAVIKETMRLFPPAAGIRTGCRDLVLQGQDGSEYPTEGCLVQVNHLSSMRNPKAWARSLEFLPDRFLVGQDHELYPPKGGWRPFEVGVRNCTGQAFVMKEIKAFLALFSREFDFQECYNEAFAGEKLDLSEVYNEKAYMADGGSAHMRGQFPCRVTLSNNASSVLV
ncbi:cytochrome P450 [Xylariomycetidae sp. FL0641]|nr:cytochrome P450 [Xylariomycetidae sp. FL0641]